MSADPSIDLRITAENEAEKAFREVEMQTKQMVKGVRDVGEQSKVSAELVGSLAAELGGGEFAAFAGTAAMLTDRVKNFSFALEGGTKAALAFKTAAGAVVGVLGFELGKQVSNWIYGINEIESAIESAAKKLGIASDPMKELAASAESPLEIALAWKEVTTRAAVALQTIEQTKKTLSDVREAANRDFDYFLLFDDLKAAEAAAVKAEVRYRQLDELRVSLESRFGDAQSAAAIEQQKRALAVSEMIQNELEKRVLAEQQIQKKAEEEAEQRRMDRLKRRLAAEEALQKTQESALNNLKQQAIALADGKMAAEQFRLEMAGIDSDMAGRLAALQERLSELQSARSSLAPGLTAQNQRLITGKGAEFRKTAADIENERQTKIQTESKKILSEIKTELQNIRPVEIYVLGE